MDIKIIFGCVAKKKRFSGLVAIEEGVIDSSMNN